VEHGLQSYNLENLNILLVEDNKHMQLLVKEILRSFRIKAVRVADDGADAIKEMRTFATDLVICDWNMQPIDGLEFVRMVRTSSDSTNPYVPVIMLTGHTEITRVLEARDSGITEFLAKPVSAKGLYQRICMVIERPRQFIKTRMYVGPDRRRTPPTDNNNKGRRASDKDDGSDDLSQDEIEKLMNS
jgi:two-component system, chemotaxis family, chemotaxis protein CheY